jgi:putative transposase
LHDPFPAKKSLTQVTLNFSRPGKATDNPSIESFNGRLRQECLIQHWFVNLKDAAAKIEEWRNDLQRLSSP